MTMNLAACAISGAGRPEGRAGSAGATAPRPASPRLAARVLLACSVAVAVALTGGTALAQDAVCAKVKLVIPQKLTFERDAFDALLTLTNNLSDAALDDLDVNVEIRTMSGELAEEQFFVSVSSLDNVTAIDGTGVILPNEMGTIHWLLIPSAGAGGTLPGGINYKVKATITYGVNGQPFDIDTYEETITVKPQPLLVLDYFLPQKVWGDDPFTAEAEPIVPYELAVRVSNIGWGPANNLQIESAQPVIVENDKGLLIDFKIIGTWLDGGSIGKSLTVLFGNLPAQGCSTGAWAMTSSLQGTFTELAVTFSHKDELGGEKTSLVEATNSHWLVHMVRLDSPGKDAEPDLLAYEIGQPEGIPTVIYESDCGTSPVSVVPASADGTPSLSDNTASVTATMQAGWCWMRAPDPALGAYPLLKVVRDSDGKVLDPRNAWIQLDENRAPYVAIFDWSTLGPLDESYTVYYDLSEFDANPPVSTLTFVGPHAGTAPIVVSSFTIINMTATDDMAGVAKRELRKDGGEWLPAAPFFFASGEHLLEYRATDKKGNVEPTRVAQIVVDAEAPVVTAIAPLPGGLYHLHEPLAVDVAIDDLDPSPSVELTIVSKDGGPGLTVSAPGTVLDVSGLAPGDYDLLATATDWMGNKGTAVIGPFTLDEYVPPAPVLTLAGVAEGAYVAAAVAVVATVEPEDVPLALTLDGQPYVAGAAIASDGVHVVAAVATDAWGQEAAATLTFTVDQTAPVVSWSGVSAGQIAGAPVTPTLTVLEPNLATQVVTLDGGSFASGTQVAAEGTHQVVAVVTDLAGNETTASVAFTVDLSPPSIVIEQVDDGAAYAVVVSPIVTITDLTLSESAVTLDGMPYLSGTPIDAEGPHTLAATATDAVGRTAEASVSFLVDLTAPTVEITGVEDGGAYAEAVTPTVAIDDANLTDSTVTLDGEPYTSDTEIAAPGARTLEATATDAAGNTTTVTVAFSIDLDAPVIAVVGVAPGAFYGAPVVPVVTVTDTDLDTVVITLDDAPFASGDPVAAEGVHVLRVTATDMAGNQSIKPVSFTIDLTAPQIVVSGVADGGVYGAAVVPAATITDATGVVVVRTLDGLAHTSGTAVAAEGSHVFAVTATDKAGNQTSVAVPFTIDLTKPSVVLAGVAAGAWVAEPVTVTVDVDDDTAATVVVLLDGAPYEPGTPIAVEGAHEVVATATDAAGNQAAASLSFGVDLTAPVVTLGGVADGALYGAPVSVGWTVDEANPASVVATLDGAPVIDGQVVSGEGSHVLSVTATDLAGNTAGVSATFEVDLTAPEVSIIGVAEGDVVMGPVVAAIAVGEPGATIVGTLDGAPWESGTPIAAEGSHTLAASATDAAGNTGVATVSFTIDATPPVITIAGVADGGIYGAAVSPAFTVTDASEVVVGALLDGEPFVSGSPVAGEGTHLLLVQATDAAGNADSEQVSFVIDLSAPPLAVSGVTDGAWYGEPVTPTVETDTDATVAATLDGAPWEPGTEVTTEGAHTLVVTVTSAAGHTAKTTLEFGVDTTPPEVAITGVADGAVVPSAAAVVVATDDNLDTVTTLLDGAPYVSGTEITTAGPHTVSVSATDLAGNGAEASVSFLVDPSAPAVTLVGVEDGAVYGEPVTVDAEVVSLSETSLSLTLDGAPLQPGGEVTDEGTHVVVAVATSETGAKGTASATFVLDFTPPVVAIAGVTEGMITAQAVTPVVTVEDATETTAIMTVDGAPWTGGAITTEGTHTLVVDATDAAGNQASASVGFVIDLSAPTLAVTGVTDGQWYAGPVTPVIETDAPGASVVATVDDLPWSSGEAVTDDGEHELIVTVTDAAGHVAKTSVVFGIDTSAPSVTVDGVTDGAVVTAATPVITVVDDHLTDTSVTLDGELFTSGTPVTEPGAHTLVVTASDLAGNETSVTITFTVDPSAPTLALVGVVDGAHYAAPVTVDLTVAGADEAPVLTIDGELASPGVLVDAEGQHVASASVSSPAGVLVTVSATFVLDFTAPVATIEGVVEGGIYGPGVAPVWTVEDAWLDGVTATLDGAPVESGAAVTEDGEHLLRVEGTDLAGNQGSAEVNFVVDGGAPTVSLLGIEDGAVVQGPVALTAEVSEGATVVVTVDDAAYEPGTPIAAEGSHAAIAVATAPSGLTAEAALTFAIDMTAPVVVFAGVDDGATVSGPVTPVVTVDDAHPGALILTLDGAAFASGGTVEAPGAHALHAVATDLAGNQGEGDLAFTIEEPPPGPLVVRVTRQGEPVVGARVVLLDGSGAWLGLQGTLDATGTWSVEPPAAGAVRVRVDRLWRRFLSPAVTWPESLELAFALPDEPEWAHTLHVRGDAPSVGDGSAAKPYRTVGQAVMAAGFDTLVRVAGGVYDESVTIPDGVAVEGGYDPDSWTLAPDGPPTVLAGQGEAPVVRFDGSFHGELAHVTVRGGGGVSVVGASPLLRNLIVEECARPDGACVDQDGGDLATMVDLLVTGNGAPAAVRIAGAATHLWNVTIADNAGTGLVLAAADVLVERAIIARNDGPAVSATGGAPRVDETLIWGNDGGVEGAVAMTGLLEEDPAFVTGPLHAHYLSQVAAGDPVDSPALDAGGMAAVDLELAALTTASSGAGDGGLVDLGFHAWPVAPQAPGEDVGSVDAGGGADAGAADAGGGVDAGGGEPDTAGGDVDSDTDAGSTDASGADAGDAAPGPDGTDGCGSCTQGRRAPVIPAGGLVLALLVLGGLLALRRSRPLR